MVTITKYVWDPVADCVVSELDGSNNVKAVYTNEPQPYGGVISQRRGTTTSTLHADALGTTRLLTDSSQTVTDTYLFDAWGNSVASTGTTVMPFKWGGKHGYYTDDSTGLVYVRARMYQPTVARWCSVDPIFPDERINGFWYVSNRVTMWGDATGLSPLCQSESCNTGPNSKGQSVLRSDDRSKWNCNVKWWENRAQEQYPVFIDTCCRATLIVFVQGRRCFEPGWEDEYEPGFPRTDAELAKHFYTDVRIRYVLTQFEPDQCGQRREWFEDSCDVFPGRFLSKMTGEWLPFPELEPPVFLSDVLNAGLSDLACCATHALPPGVS